ncbi:MFS transporter [Novosphingobium colocasiae]
MILIAAASAQLPLAAPDDTADHQGTGSPARDVATWLLVATAVIYSIAEGIFTNWTILYLRGKAMDGATASLALTAFLGGITAGRLLASFLAISVRPLVFLYTLPILIAFAFLALPDVNSAGGAILAFGFAGLACSAYFPMLITHAASAYPAAMGWIATLMISAQMVGIGIGTFVVGGLVGLVPFERLYQTSIALPIATLVLLALASRVREAKRQIAMPA